MERKGRLRNRGGAGTGGKVAGGREPAEAVGRSGTGVAAVGGEMVPRGKTGGIAEVGGMDGDAIGPTAGADAER